MDEFHLLQHRRLERRMREPVGLLGSESTDLARFTRSQQQHFDLILCHHPIPLELALDFIIAWSTG
jgi:hypothetical protein